jgi:hypothetical protein
MPIEQQERKTEHNANVVGGSLVFGVVGLAVGGPFAGIVAAVSVPLGSLALRHFVPADPPQDDSPPTIRSAR